MFSKYPVAIRVMLITAIFTIVLAALKLTFGYIGSSHALFADGIHSLADVLIDTLVLFAAHYGSKSADSNHPYGHGRIETAATFGLALILVLTGIGIMLNAGEHVWGKIPAPRPELITLWIAIAAIVVNEGLFRYTLRAAKNTQSPLLTANAWHSRSDAATSVVVVLGIGGALLGFHYLDALAAIVVGIFIIKMGIKLGWSSIAELVDTGVDDHTLIQIKEVIKQVPGVCTLHQLRTRTINNKIFLDVHVLVDAKISVSEGHYIGDQVYIALKKHIEKIADVTVHVDPEDDEIVKPSDNLPNRKEIIVQLHQHWEKYLPKEILDNALTHITLHYLNGRLQIELHLPKAFADHEEKLKQAVNDLDYLIKIETFFY